MASHIVSKHLYVLTARGMSATSNLGSTIGKLGSLVVQGMLASWFFRHSEVNQRYKNSNLTYIGTQRCLDCPSSPVSELHARSIDQGWTTVFTLNEPDLPVGGVSAADAAEWYIQWVNPLNISESLE
jgi:hypothetical protein